MSSDKSPTKSSRSGASSDSHTKLSGSQKNTKESSKATRRPLLSSSTERIDEPTPLKKVTPVKSQQQSPRSRTKSESSDKAISEDGEGQKKSKAELRAERRAIQEAQRALKAQKQAEQKGRPSNDKGPQQLPTQRVATNVLADDKKVQAKVAKKLAKQQVPQRAECSKQVVLFAHLHQYTHEFSLTKSLSFGLGSSLHPAVVKVGLQYASGIICGSNARCIAMLAAFKKAFQDYTTPPERELCRDLEATINPYINYLDQCRTLSVSMRNAIKHLKMKITSIPPGMPEEEAKAMLCESLDKFLKEKILLAGEAIANACCDIIKSGDVILVYAYSSIVLGSLLVAHRKGIEFRVIVVDSRPKMEGRKVLNNLTQYGIKCSYILINAVTYIMKEVSKVFLGAHALLANGYVMSRVGTSLIALVAKTFNVPVLVCCETYKFSDRVQTDSFVFNELGDPSDLVLISKENFLSDWQSIKSLNLLNLVYDVTSPDLIAMVVTELGKIPCTSVPVVLRMSRDASL